MDANRQRTRQREEFPTGTDPGQLDEPGQIPVGDELAAQQAWDETQAGYDAGSGPLGERDVGGVLPKDKRSKT